ncbi:hypothetical protein HELRODRAFT_192905 [Helobdella robusta]|uniref:Uncharacterized protein n=1 Tax=Helobdella robusta TaxID=6412 RepID=T1FUE8_HELRO|nr:hypothetical protein HELRODRAFT_192905 [Helobdella robusta]ESN98405.1 hypothetical protein HELRODRAFT_192905 [Helobdella robusta]
MLTVVCACMVKLILGKRSRRNSTSTPPLPQSFLDQTTSHTNPLFHYPPPQAQPGSVNPYNEPPPSYYYAHFTSAVDKMEEEGSGEREGSVRIIPVPPGPSTNNSEIGRNTDSNTHPPLSELPPYETYKDDRCMDPQLLQELQEANDSNNHNNVTDTNSIQMNTTSDNISNSSTVNNFTDSTSSNACNDNMTNGNRTNSTLDNANFDSNSGKSIGKNGKQDGKGKIYVRADGVITPWPPQKMIKTSR